MRDPMALLGTGLSELKASSAGSKFFSGEWKSVARNSGNYMIDLEEMMDDEDGAETLKKMKVVENKRWLRGQFSRSCQSMAWLIQRH